MSTIIKKVSFVLGMLLLSIPVFAQPRTVLFFVSYEETYYSEYIVMRRALEAAGYAVDVRSAHTDSASTYMVPANTDISATAATLPGGSYAQFTQMFQNYFDSSWSAAWNPTPGFIPLNGRIQDVLNMNQYEALVIAGGTGVTAYRVDGSYSSQGSGARLLSAGIIQDVSLKLNTLAIEALQQGKPVLAQCHGASLPAFWRIPGTSGTGIDSIGFSLLRNQFATGFPEPQTATTLSSLTINYRADDRITISGPHASLPFAQRGRSKIITTRDWYPQTVASAARSLINIMETFPQHNVLHQQRQVLILHGGIIDSTNCSPANRSNDVPCNHGAGLNLPADYRHVAALLSGSSPNDSFQFLVTHLNISGSTLPYLPSSISSIYNFLLNFHTVIFFKHWSTDVTIPLQLALKNYADNGGGLLALHHGLYNDSINNLLNKNILRDSIFGAESNSNTWSGVTLANQNLFITDYGHFITTYGITPGTPLTSPGAWVSAPLPAVANQNGANFQRINIFDETYNNMVLRSGIVWGRKVNQHCPLFSNDLTPAAQSHAAGFVRLFNPSSDSTIGKVAYMQPGERRESFLISHPYAQMVRNAVFWVADKSAYQVLPVTLTRFDVTCQNDSAVMEWETSAQVNLHSYTIEVSHDAKVWKPVKQIRTSASTLMAQTYKVWLSSAYKYYRFRATDFDGTTTFSPVRYVSCSDVAKSYEIVLSPNPAHAKLHISSKSSDLFTCTIYSLTGKVVVEQTGISGSGQLDISSLPNGMYMVHVWINGTRIAKKLIIAH